MVTPLWGFKIMDTLGDVTIAGETPALPLYIVYIIQLHNNILWFE
jgi:hypothetical protein